MPAGSRHALLAEEILMEQIKRAAAFARTGATTGACAAPETPA